MTSELSKSHDQKEALVTYWLEKAHESLQSARSEYESGRLSFAMIQALLCRLLCAYSTFQGQGPRIQET